MFGYRGIIGWSTTFAGDKRFSCFEDVRGTDMLTPEQSRAARGLLDWSQTELAREANLSESTIRDFEKGRRVPAANNLAAIVDAFHRNGVTLISDASTSETGGFGVRMTAPSQIGQLRRELEHVDSEIKNVNAQIGSLLALTQSYENLVNDTLFIEHRIKLEQELQTIKSERKKIIDKINRIEENRFKL